MHIGLILRIKISIKIVCPECNKNDYKYNLLTTLTLNIKKLTYSKENHN